MKLLKAPAGYFIIYVHGVMHGLRIWILFGRIQARKSAGSGYTVQQM